MKTSQDLLDELLECETNTQRIDAIQKHISEVINETVEICKCHADNGCFDYEGALSNSEKLAL